jgi:hypothetical protein
MYSGKIAVPPGGGGIRKLIIPGDQEGLFKLAKQLRTFFYSAIYNTATGYVLWVCLTDI